MLDRYINGESPFPPGAVYDMDVLQTGSVIATVALIVYADKTAEVADNHILQTIMTDRAAQAKVMQQINDILSSSPTAAAAAQKLNELYATRTDSTPASFGLEIKTTLQNLQDLRSEEHAAMRAMMARNEKYIPAMAEHSQLTKAVQR